MPTTIDPSDLAQFEHIASQWWDPQGPFRPLHQINPIRIEYIYNVCQRLFQRSPDQRLVGLDMLDVGCGGGLVTEAVARLGATVTGVDAGSDAILTAQQHAAQHQLHIDYHCGEIENLRLSLPKYDVVMALEIIEHVADISSFMTTLSHMLKPTGVLIISTLNRTVKSYLLGIVAAEYILRWVPRGTHQWDKFLKPSELAACARQNNLRLDEIKGLTFNPFNQQWTISHDTAVNYFMVMQPASICN